MTTGGDLVWVSGSLSRSIDPLDRGFLLGDGVFDTLVAFNRIPFAGEDHLERLTRHAATIGIAFEIEAVRQGWRHVLEHAVTDQQILRTTISRGKTARGLWPASQPAPTIVVSATPWDPRLLGTATDLAVSSIPRNAASPLSCIKSINYLEHVLAAREASQCAADDALFLTEGGMVACTTIANVFAIFGSDLVTPPASDGAMLGITRKLVLEAAATTGLRATERSISLKELHEADSAFVTNSVRFVCPIRSIDGRPTATRRDDGRRALQSALFARVLAECGFDLYSVA
jgi:branched-chain amino acid aminotransferase